MLQTVAETAKEAGNLQEAPGPRVVRVAIAGCGVVGSELVRLVHGQVREIVAADATRLEIVSVLVRRPDVERGLPLARDRFTGDPARFLAADAEVVVEAVGGTDIALEIARHTLRAGRRLVTANKALLARHGAELAALARRHGGGLDFEGAVGGGVPIVRALRDTLASSGPTEITGVLNGTTNYILTRLAEGVDFGEALAAAQRLGFAEADPSRDLSGADAADKIAVLAWLAFGVDPARLEVRTRGLAGVADRIAADGRAFGGVPRLVARVAAGEQGVVASVEPTIVAADSEIGRTREERNVVVVETRWNGRIALSGPGAGGSPTAAVLLADVRRGARRLSRVEAPEPRGGEAEVGRWSMSVVRREGTGSELREQLGRAGLQAERLEIDSDAGVVRTILAPAPWTRVAGLERGLLAGGLEPVVTRFALQGR